MSEFDDRVYAAVVRVPRGCVTTYAAIARAIGCRSARAVGQALKRNSLAPDVPCHRVIASDLTLGGFRGCRDRAAARNKATLLAEEGVRFGNGRLTDRSRLIALDVTQKP